MVAPGETDLTLREPGSYTTYYEYQSTFGDKVYSTDENISGLACVLISKANNSRVTLLPPTIKSAYGYPHRSGRSILAFKIDQPGCYTLSAGYPKSQRGPEVVLAVGKDFTITFFSTIHKMEAVAFASYGIAVAISLITALKRSKNEKLLANQVARQ